VNDTERAEQRGLALEEIANTLRGYLLMGERVEPNNAAFGFGEAKRLIREAVARADAVMEETEEAS
jgi:hypothetical protein